MNRTGLEGPLSTLKNLREQLMEENDYEMTQMELHRRNATRIQQKLYTIDSQISLLQRMMDHAAQQAPKIDCE